jgi:hypothetical protein
MSDNLIAALIGLGGVVAGTFLGWFLSAFWEARKYRRERRNQALKNLRETLLAFLRVVEENDLRNWSYSWLEVTMALNVSTRDRELRAMIDELPKREIGMIEARGLERSIREIIQRIDKLMY